MPRFYFIKKFCYLPVSSHSWYIQFGFPIYFSPDKNCDEELSGGSSSLEKMGRGLLKF